MINVSIKGVDPLLTTFFKAPAKLKAGVKRTFNEIGGILTKTAKDEHRFVTRTGNLEKDIGFTIKNYQIIFGLYHNAAMTKIKDGFYSEFIHNGFKSWSPDEFIYKSFDSNKNRIEQLYKELLNNIVKDLD